MINNNYKFYFGVEIHAQLITNTKMFSPSKVLENYNNVKPNTYINEIDLGYPGAKPSVNEEAVRKAIIMCKVLKMEIDSYMRFDRKHYFYFDLPKGYQITQYFFPIGKNGELSIFVNGKERKIKINELHLEEDTAKQIHRGNKTLIDYNRAGIPLIEIVSDYYSFESIDDVQKYVQTVRNLLVDLNLSKGKLEEGSLRCDINISLRDLSKNNWTPKIEIKNLNSFNNIKKALEFEIKKIIYDYENNIEIMSTTKRFDETKKETIEMRKKIATIDYHYMRDFNILPINIPKELLEVKKEKEYIFETEKNLLDLGIDYKIVEQIINNFDLLNFYRIFETKILNKAKFIKLLISNILKYVNKNEIKITDLKIDENLINFVNYYIDGKIPNNNIDNFLEKIIENNEKIDFLLKDIENNQISNVVVIDEMIAKIIKENQNLMKDFSTRPERVEKFIMGQMMKQTKGNIDPVSVMKMIKKQLEKYESL